MAAMTAIILTAVGAGVAAYGSYQQGKSQQYMADLNAAQQERNARNQLLAMQTQANLTKQQAQAQFAMQSSAAQGRFNNATSMETAALAQDRVNRVNLRKRREEFEEFQATQRAAVGVNNLAESETTLDNLAKTAEVIAQDQEEQSYGFEMQRRTLFREAEMERFGGKLAMAGATLDRDSGVMAAGLQQAAAKAEYLGNLRAAEITRIGGQQAKRAGAIGAGATLLSGAGQAGGMYNYHNPRIPKATVVTS